MAVVERISVSLRIIGQDLDPDVITAWLGTSPSSSRRRGDTNMATRNGSAWKSGAWFLNAETEGESLDALVRRVLAKVDSSPQTWARIHQAFDADLFCGLFLDGLNRGTHLESETAALIGKLGLTIEFDIYGLRAVR